MKTKLAIWVPMEPKTGLGHLYRSFHLYERYKNSFFFTNRPHVNLYFRIKKKLSEDPEVIERYLTNDSVTHLMIDHYFLNKNIIDFFSKNSKLKVCFFDRDFTNKAFDGIINSNPYVCNANIKSRHQETNYFMGGAYYGFRKEIKKAKGIRKNSDQIFICFGGSDVKSLALKIMDYLAKDYFYQIVLGPGVSPEYIKAVTLSFNKNQLKGEILFNPADFFQRFSASSKAVLSASTIGYESCFLDTNFICFQTADNQNNLSEYYQKKGVVVLNENDINGLTELLYEDHAFKHIKMDLGCKLEHLYQFFEEI